MGIAVPILVFLVHFMNLAFGKLIIKDKKKKISETDGKNIQIIGIIVMLIIGFGVLFKLDILDSDVMKWYWLGFLTLTLGFQSILEWNFLKESKKYIVTLITLIIGILYILIFIF